MKSTARSRRPQGEAPRGRRTVVAAALAAAALAGCGWGRRPAVIAPGPVLRLGVPATYAGTLPCADCPGLRTTLTLRPDGTFRLRQVYLQVDNGADRAAIDLGRWRLLRGGGVLVLGSGAGGARRFAVRGQGALRLLDSLGREIVSRLPYDLTRAARIDPIRDSFRLRGLYTDPGGAGRLTECRTGSGFRVLQEGENDALAKAYASARRAAGEPVLVTFTGHLEERPRAGGVGTEDVVVVERFDRAWPGESCTGALPPPRRAPRRAPIARLRG